MVNLIEVSVGADYRVDLGCWYLIWGDTQQTGIAVTLCLHSCMEKSQHRAYSQGSLGELRGFTVKRSAQH